MYSLLHHFTCGFTVSFLNKKNGHKLLGFHGGGEPAASGQRERIPAQVQFVAGLPEEMSCVDFGTCCQSLPTNSAFFFFLTDVLAQDLARELGKKKKKGKERRGKKKQPQGWRKILYACALKHRVCGQLLEDFSGESRLSRVNRVREGEKESVL